jgi:dUTP pyrophosphatase
MNTLQFQRLDPRAILPTRGSASAIGLDIYSIESVYLSPGERCSIRTGLAVSIPSGFYGRIAPRSGLALKHGLDVLAGVVDSDYRGEIRCLLVNLGTDHSEICIGDRIAQLIVERAAILKPEWTDTLEETVRSVAGFGSTGR